MRPFRHPKDEGLKFARTLGKRRWKRDLVAQAAPQECGHFLEEEIQGQLEKDLQAAGTPYIVIPTYVYALLKREAAKGDFRAMDALAALKDLPDLTVLRKVEGEPWTRALPLEVKRLVGRASPGQKRVAAAAGGVIAKGLEACQRVMREFLNG